MTEQSSLADRGIYGAFWNYAGGMIRILMQVVTGIVFARLLGPEAMGIYAAILLVTGVTSLFVDAGIGAVIVQKEELQPVVIASLFNWSLLAGGGLCLAVMFSADWIAAYFKNPDIIPYVNGAAAFLLFFSLSVVPGALLRREMRLKQYQLNQLLSYGIAYLLVGVSMAASGWGVLSAITALVLQAVLFGGLCLFSARHDWRYMLTLSLNPYRGFGGQVLLTNMFNWLIENIDNLLVGRLFSVYSLGLYAVVYNLVRVPTNFFMNTLQSVIFPLASRADKDKHHQQLQDVYLANLSLILFVVAPMFMGIAVAAESVIVALYGESWKEAAALLAPIAIAMIMHSMQTGSVLLWSAGKVHVELQIQWKVVIMLVLAVLLSSQLSLPAVAWSVAGVYFIRAAMMTRRVLTLLDISAMRWFSAVAGPFGIALVVACVIGLVDIQLKTVGVTALGRLSADIVVGALSLIVLLRMSADLLITSELAWLLEAVLSRAPAGVTRLIHAVFKLPAIKGQE